MNPFTRHKILAYPDRIAQWKSIGTTWPVLLGLCLTDKCLHSCPECNGGRTGNELDASVALRILREFRDGGTQAVTFAGGGEPLMHPEIAQILHQAKDIGYSIGLITNGAGLSEDALAAIVSCCKWVRFSLDAGDQHTYRLSHGELANWNITLENIKLLVSAKTDGLYIGASYLLSDVTLPSAIEAMKLCKDMGLAYIQFKPYDGDTQVNDFFIHNLQQRYNSETFSVVGFVQRPSPRHYQRCHAMHFIAEVAANGAMYPCCVYRNRKVRPVGNIHQESVAAILGCRAFLDAADASVDKCPNPCRNHRLNNTLQDLFLDLPEHCEFL